MGNFVIGLALVVLTPWRLFKHCWVMSNFLITIALILFAMFLNAHRILANMELRAIQGIPALKSPTFMGSSNTLKVGVIDLAAGFLFLISIAVHKPGMKK